MKKYVIIPAFLATSFILSTANANQLLQCSKVHFPALRKSPQVSAQEAEKKYQSFLQVLKRNGLSDDFSTPDKRIAALQTAVTVGDPVLLGYLAGHGFKNELSNPKIENGSNRIPLVHTASAAGKIENIIFLLRQIKDAKLILQDGNLWDLIAHNQRLDNDGTKTLIFSEEEFLSVIQILADKKAFPQDAQAEGVSGAYQNLLLYRMYMKGISPDTLEKLIGILSKAGVDIFSKKVFGSYGLAESILQYGGERSVDLFRVLMRHKFNPNEINPIQRQSYFHHACSNDVKLARFFIENGADIKAVSEGGFNALGYLAMNTNSAQQKDVLELAKLLIRKGASPNVESADHGTPLGIASMYGNTKMVEVLLPLTDFSKIKYPGDLVVSAAQNKSLKMLQALERKGVSLSSRSRSGDSALYSAVATRDIEIVKYLLSKGVSAKGAHSNDGHLAGLALSISPEMFELMVSHGVDLNSVDRYGRSIFHYLVYSTNPPKDLSFLEKVTVSLDQKDFQGFTALQTIQLRSPTAGGKRLSEFITNRLVAKMKSRESFRMSQEELILMLTSALSEVDPNSNKKTIEDLSIEDIISALRLLEKKNALVDVKLSEIIYDKVKRRDTGVELIKGFFATERNFKPSNSLELFAKVTGLPFEAIKNNKYSEKTLGDFFEITLSLQASASRPIFQNSKVDPKLLVNNQLTAFGHYLSRIRIVTMVSEVKADRIFSYLPELTLEKLQEIEKKRLGPIMVQAFKKMFADPNMKFSYEQFMELYQKWGDIEPVMTLLARYNQRDDWKKNIPLLVEVFKTSLSNDFGDFKFGKKNSKSAEQLKGMSESQIAEWMKPRTKVSLAPKPELDPNLFEGLRDQVMGDLVRKVSVTPLGGDTGFAKEAMSLKMAPKQIIQKMMADKKMSQEAIVGQIYSDLAQILLTTKDVAVLRKSVDWLRTLAINEPSLIKKGDMDGFNKTLLGLRQSIEGISSQSAEGPILLSVVSHDPKFLLMLGDLVQATSCQNYRTGSVIGTLLGYVTDANVQAMVSYVITEPLFKTPADFKKVQDAVSKGQLADTRFDGNKRMVQFSLKSGEVVETQFLGYGYLRNALKLGHRDNGTPGIFLERDYVQNHPNIEQLKAQHKELLIEVAKAAHTEINGALSIAGSRSPGGIYSDAGGGQKQGPYSVNIPQMEP